MFQDNKNFYPTPLDVVEIMLEGIKLYDRTSILEPSAGRGNLLDSLIEIYNKQHPDYYRYEYNKSHISCIEIDVELQAILRDKGYKIIDSDFLNYIPEQSFDLILMNPPFDNGVKHLLKAIEISDGAEIRCLLNSETINNPFSKERKLLLDLMEKYGGKIKNLGNCFKNADRTTNVDVVLVSIPKKVREYKFKFEGNKSSGEKFYKLEDINTNQVARLDVYGNLVDRYNKLKEVMTRYLSIEKELEYYSKDLISYRKDIKEIITDVKKSLGANYTQDDVYEQFVKELKKCCWENILDTTKLADRMTSSVKKDFHKIQQEQGYLSFTLDNIEDLFISLGMSQKEIMENCIVEAFENMTKYHKENRLHIEGWVSVNPYKVNKKVIFPNIVSKDYNNTPSLNYRHNDTIIDIEKALCFVSGIKYEKMRYNSICVIIHDGVEFGTWNDSHFFKFKVYKKGTLHIEFKDLKLHQEFNLRACKGKNWVGASYHSEYPKHKDDIKQEDIEVQEKEIEQFKQSIENELNNFLQLK